MDKCKSSKKKEMKISLDVLKSNKILVISDQVIFSGLNFATTLFLASILSVSDFGIYSTIIISVYLIISLGNSIIIQPFQVADKVFKSSSTYSYFLFLFQVLFLVAILIITSIIQLLLNISTYHILSLILLISGIVLHDYFRKYYLASTEVKMVLKLDSIVTISQIGLMFFLFLTGVSDLNSVLFLVGVSYLLAVAYSIYSLKPQLINLIEWKVYFNYHKREGLWLSLVSFIQWGSGNLFVLSLGLFVSIEALGAFRLIQSMFGVLNILFQTFENYVLPNASRIYSDSISASKDYIKKVSFQSSLVIGLVLLILFIYSKEVMMLTTGLKYLEYSSIIKGMCILYFILFIGYPIRLCVRMLLMNKIFFTGYLLSFVFSIVFFKYLIKHWELNGVILGLVINQLIMLIFWSYKLHQEKFYLWK